MNYLIGKNGNYFEVGTSGSMHVFSSDDDYSIGFEEYPKFFLPMAALYLAAFILDAAISQLRKEILRKGLLYLVFFRVVFVKILGRN